MLTTPDSIELTPGWTEQQVNEVKRLFGDFKFNKSYIPLIRLQIAQNPILRNKKTPKNIYDKIKQIQRKEIGKVKENVLNVPLEPGDRLVILNIFSDLIKGSMAIKADDIYNTFQTSLLGNELLKRYSFDKLLAKVRYERQEHHKRENRKH